MTGPQEPPLRHGSGRVLMLGSFVLAVAAAATLALGAQDASLLRLGIVAALWAALLGSFAAVRMRRDADSGADRAEEMRVIYRLELDREIAARREHELRVERELREHAERRARDNIAALHGELQTLRETLRNLLGGDVLVERVALRAESTRLLPLADPSRNVADGRGRIPAAEQVGGAPRSLTVAQAPARAAGGSGRDPWDVGQRPDPPYRRPEPAAAPRRPAAESPPHRNRFDGSTVGSRLDGSTVGSRFDGSTVGDADSRAAPGRDDSPELDIFARTAAELAAKTGSDRTWSPAVPAAPAVRDQDSPEEVSRQGVTGGRHSRPGAHSNGAHSNGAHSNGEPGNRHGGGHRRAPDGRSAESAGAHGGGRPVDDLLAAYGEVSAPRRRRRRADD